MLIGKNSLMKIIDNFLSKKNFTNLQSLILGQNFPWFYNDYIHHVGDGQFQYFHTFYSDEGNPSWQFSLLNDCLKELKPIRIKRIKANSNPKTESHSRGGYHVDYPNIKTSILYVNTNNGWTEFKNGDRVDCIENRMVIFDSNLEHQGVSSTDQKRKVVINFNYE